MPSRNPTQGRAPRSERAAYEDVETEVDWDGWDTLFKTYSRPITGTIVNDESLSLFNPGSFRSKKVRLYEIYKIFCSDTNRSQAGTVAMTRTVCMKVVMTHGFLPSLVE